MEKNKENLIWFLLAYSAVLVYFFAVSLNDITQLYSDGMVNNCVVPKISKTSIKRDVLPDKDSNVIRRTGKASFYDYVLKSGWSSKGRLVCATRDFPRYSTVKVTNKANGKSVTCKVTDFGPDASVFPDRVVDLSSHAFSQIASLGQGVINVSVE